VSDRRENRLLRGGLLIGFGVGLCIGVALMFTAVGFLLIGHRSILGLQWARLLVFPVAPLVAFGVGGWLLWRARRAEA
jgi:type VI protein secretion system component VasK